MVLTSLPGSAQQRGEATYYSKRATGARTSSGVRLHHDSLTCAHRTYPFGSKLLVKNLSNGKEVVVTVTDRGPYGRGKIVDLTYEAARRLGMLDQGIATVEVSLCYDNQGIPFAREEEKLPEFDFGINDSGDDASSEIPVWQREKKNQGTKKKASKTLACNAPADNFGAKAEITLESEKSSISSNSSKSSKRGSNNSSRHKKRRK